MRGLRRPIDESVRPAYISPVEPVPQSPARAETLKVPEPLSDPTPTFTVSEPAPDLGPDSIPTVELIPPAVDMFSIDTPPLETMTSTSGTWRFNFHDAPWETVLKAFARHSNMSLLLEQYPAEQLTYYDDRYYSTSEALDVLNDHLLAQGFLLV